MKVPTVSHRRLTSFDGTRLAYQVRGSGPVVVLANGFCASYTSFRHIYRVFSDDYKVICWDYRGLFGSGRAPDRRAYSLDHQVRDLEMILAHEGVDRALFLGWSMGVQVLLEYFRVHPEQFDGFIALHGTWARPYHTVGDSPAAPWIARHLLPGGSRLFAAMSPLFHRLIRPVTGWSKLVPAAERVGFIKWLHRVGFMAPTLDLDVAEDLMREYSALDFGAVAHTTWHLIHHDAGDVLPTVDVPALVVAGSADWITPQRLSETMASVMPRAELAVVPGATHYGPVEYPEHYSRYLGPFVQALRLRAANRKTA